MPVLPGVDLGGRGVKCSLRSPLFKETPSKGHAPAAARNKGRPAAKPRLSVIAWGDVRAFFDAQDGLEQITSICQDTDVSDAPLSSSYTPYQPVAGPCRPLARSRGCLPLTTGPDAVTRPYKT